MAWSQGRDGGNLLAAFFSKIVLKSLTKSGMISSKDFSFWSFLAAIAISVDLLTFRIWFLRYHCSMVLEGLCVSLSESSDSSSSSYIVCMKDATKSWFSGWLGKPHNIPSGGSCSDWYLWIRCCFLIISVGIVMRPLSQSIFGLYLRIHGMPNRTSSRPMSAMYQLVGNFFPLRLKVPSTRCVMVPILLTLSSAFRKVRVFGSLTVGRLYFSTIFRLTMTASAPVSMSPLISTALFPTCM